MMYAHNAQLFFDVALEMFEGFREQGTMSKIEQTKFCIAVEKHLYNFNSWYGCSPAEAKAYQVFVKSTPLAPLLELPQDKWISWLKKYISEKASS